MSNDFANIVFFSRFFLYLVLIFFFICRSCLWVTLNQMWNRIFPRLIPRKPVVTICQKWQQTYKVRCEDILQRHALIYRLAFTEATDWFFIGKYMLNKFQSLSCKEHLVWKPDETKIEFFFESGIEPLVSPEITLDFYSSVHILLCDALLFFFFILLKMLCLLTIVVLAVYSILLCKDHTHVNICMLFAFRSPWVMTHY